MTTNILTSFLELLRVKHTKKFTHKYYNEHPHKHNLYGLSTMLSDYRVESIAIKTEDKETDLFNIDLPFIAHTGDGFVVMSEADSENVSYLWNEKKITIPFSQFIQSWSGVALLAEVSPCSIEPNYIENRNKELFTSAQKGLLAIAGILIFGLAYIRQELFTDLGITLLLFINLTGIYICYLLVLKSEHLHSQYADKICSLFSKRDCNNVLESPAAKLWGVFSWAAIGLGYFIATTLLLLFFPQTVSLVAILNIFTLPYAFWSVWYQKVKARQWCPLCLIVMVQLWALFIINLVFGFIQFPEFALTTLMPLLMVGSVYALCVFTLTLIIPKLTKSGELESIKQEINSIKANEKVFDILLKEQSLYEVSNVDSQFFFGNPEADLKITIFTNPFCNPCATMHKRVKKLLRETDGVFCVQYIFASFYSDFSFIDKYLVATHLQKERDEFERIVADWFERGKPLGEAFFSNLGLDIEDPKIEAELQKHKAWTKKSQLRATPTILVNGYKLPDNYKIEDLRYFANIEICSKN